MRCSFGNFDPQTVDVNGIMMEIESHSVNFIKFNSAKGKIKG